jgi:hypothetical protein
MSEVFTRRLHSITRKWWFYVLLLLPVLAGTYASKGYDMRQSMDVIREALANPLIYRFPILFPIAKAIPLILIIGVLIFGNRVRLAFNVYASLLFLAIAIFQNTAQTRTYGFVISTGNLIMLLIVTLLWVWELFVVKNDFSPRRRSVWRWWPVPLAVLALWAPINSNTLAPDFSLGRMLTSESGLTSCMMLAVILSVLSLYYPTVNLVLMRIMSFVGVFFGILNIVTWFVITPSGWWMGIMHVPLFVISIYTFVLSHSKRLFRTPDERISYYEA